MAVITKNELDTLVKLQEAETETVRIQTYLKDVDKEKEGLEQKLTTYVHVLDEKKEGLEKVISAVKDMELELQTIEERIKKSTETLKHVKTDKEYQVLQREIDNNKKRVDQLEGTLLGKMEEREQKEAELKTQETDLLQVTEKIRAEQATMDEKCANDRELLETYRIKKNEIGAALSAELLDTFNDISRVGGGLAVTEVRDGVCRGCFMNIPPQMFIEVQRGKDLILCPQCNRILYFKEKVVP